MMPATNEHGGEPVSIAVQHVEGDENPSELNTLSSARSYRHQQFGSTGSRSTTREEDNPNSMSMGPSAASSAASSIQSCDSRPLRNSGCEPAQPRWYKHPGLKKHRKIVFISLTFLIFGIASLVTGCVLEANPKFEEASLDGVILIVIGVVLLIPGLYFVGFIAMALRGKPGYDFQRLTNLSS